MQATRRHPDYCLQFILQEQICGGECFYNITNYYFA